MAYLVFGPLSAKPSPVFKTAMDKGEANETHQDALERTGQNEAYGRSVQKKIAALKGGKRGPSDDDPDDVGAKLTEQAQKLIASMEREEQHRQKRMKFDMLSKLYDTAPPVEQVAIRAKLMELYHSIDSAPAPAPASN